MTYHPLRASLAAAGFFLLAAHSWAGDLTVTVDGITPGQGEVRIALFDNANGFPASVPRSGQTAPAAKPALVFVFKDLAPGRYALSAFQDKNSNQRLDANMMGMPTEPYGFSNDVHGSFGPPKFDDAAFKVDAAPHAITVHLK